MTEDLAAVASKPRKSEVLWMWAAIILVGVVLLLLVSKFVPLNWFTLTVAIVGFGLIVYLLWANARPEPVWHVTDSILLAMRVERDLTGISLDNSPDRCHSGWDGTTHAILFRDPRHPLLYLVDPVQRKVQTRRPLSLSRNEREREKSKLVGTALTESVKKNKQDEELSKYGLAMEDDDGTQ